MLFLHKKCLRQDIKLNIGQSLYVIPHLLRDLNTLSLRQYTPQKIVSATVIVHSAIAVFVLRNTPRRCP